MFQNIHTVYVTPQIEVEKQKEGCIPNIGIHRASISKMYEIQNSCHWVENNGGPPMSRETAYCLARGPPPMCRETAYWTPTS